MEAFATVNSIEKKKNIALANIYYLPWAKYCSKAFILTSSEQSYKLGTIMSLNFQLKKIRHREVM